MKSAEFRRLMSETADVDLIDICLRDDAPPYVFNSQQSWDSFRDAIAQAINISRADIRVVGSARFGFSMKPRSYFKLFHESSDIDVVVVNEKLFDWFWIALLTAAYPRHAIFRGAGGWSAKGRSELYAGWLTPLMVHIDRRVLGMKALPVLEFKTKWFNALKEASRFPSHRHEDVQGRLYRTWRHAELYHLYSLSELRRSLFGGQP